MARSQVQSDQVVYDSAMTNLATDARARLDSILSKTNSSLGSPCRLSCLGTDAVVTVSASKIVDGAGHGRTFPFLEGKIMTDNVGGTVDLNATGSQTGDVQNYTVPSGMTVNDYIFAGFDLRVDKKIHVVFGSANASVDLCGAPTFVGIPVGFALLRAATSSTFTTLTKPNLHQFIGAGSGGGGGNISDWETLKEYRVNNLVRITTEGYEGYWRATVNHAAAALFSTDFDAGKWELFASLMGPREVLAQPSASYFAAQNVAAVSTTGAYILGKADVGTTAEVKGIVSAATANYFILSKTGSKVTFAGGWTPARVAGETQFLSAATEGLASATEPSVVGQIRLPIGQAITTTTVDVLIGAGTTVGGTNVSTVIGLTLAGTTVIQNVSAWPNGGGGKINGTITVLGPSPIQASRVEISFTKISSTAYNISPAFPSSSIIAASGALSASVNETNGNISITLPTITSATSASVTFSIDSAALGAQLPLQIDSNLISWREPTMFRNRIQNGNMAIDQRNAGTLVNPAVNGLYYIDRWRAISAAAGKFSIGQNAGAVARPLGFTNYLGVTSLSAYSVGASENFGIRHSIEGYNVADLGWGNPDAKSVTFSFWVRSSLTGTFGATLRNEAQNRVCPVTYSILAANTWEYKTITVPGDTSGTWNTTNGIGIELQFNLGSGATVSGGTVGVWGAGSFQAPSGTVSVVGTNGATFYLTGVQLEPGSVATPFEFRPYGTELALCQRYCYVPSIGAAAARVAYGHSKSTTQAEVAFRLPVTMRIAPVCSLSNMTGWALSDAVTFTSITGFSDHAIVNTADMAIAISDVASGLTTYRSYFLECNSNPTAKIIISAEL